MRETSCPRDHQIIRDDRGAAWCRETGQPVCNDVKCAGCGELTNPDDLDDELCPGCIALCVSCGENEAEGEDAYGNHVCAECYAIDGGPVLVKAWPVDHLELGVSHAG